MSGIPRGWRSVGPLVVVLTVGLAREAPAQGAGPASGARSIAVEGAVGWAGFVDDATDHHTLAGGAVRVPIGRRASVGPEVFVTSRSHDRDVFVLGSIWIDLGPAPERARVVPYVVAGGGYMQHRQRFGTQRFVSGEGSFTAGGGVRAQLTDRVYAGGDVRIGWELHLRIAGIVGVTWPR